MKNKKIIGILIFLMLVLQAGLGSRSIIRSNYVNQTPSKMDKSDNFEKFNKLMKNIGNEIIKEPLRLHNYNEKYQTVSFGTSSNETVEYGDYYNISFHVSLNGANISSYYLYIFKDHSTFESFYVSGQNITVDLYDYPNYVNVIIKYHDTSSGKDYFLLYPSVIYLSSNQIYNLVFPSNVLSPINVYYDSNITDKVNFGLTYSNLTLLYRFTRLSDTNDTSEEVIVTNVTNINLYYFVVRSSDIYVIRDAISIGSAYNYSIDNVIDSIPSSSWLGIDYEAITTNTSASIALNLTMRDILSDLEFTFGVGYLTPPVKILMYKNSTGLSLGISEISVMESASYNGYNAIVYNIYSSIDKFNTTMNQNVTRNIDVKNLVLNIKSASTFFDNGKLVLRVFTSLTDPYGREVIEARYVNTTSNIYSYIGIKVNLYYTPSSTLIYTTESYHYSQPITINDIDSLLPKSISDIRFNLTLVANFTTVYSVLNGFYTLQLVKNWLTYNNWIGYIGHNNSELINFEDTSNNIFIFNLIGTYYQVDSGKMVTKVIDIGKILSSGNIIGTLSGNIYNYSVVVDNSTILNVLVEDSGNGVFHFEVGLSVYNLDINDIKWSYIIQANSSSQVTYGELGLENGVYFNFTSNYFSIAFENKRLIRDMQIGFHYFLEKGLLLEILKGKISFYIGIHSYSELDNGLKMVICEANKFEINNYIYKLNDMREKLSKMLDLVPNAEQILTQIDAVEEMFYNSLTFMQYGKFNESYLYMENGLRAFKQLISNFYSNVIATLEKRKSLIPELSNPGKVWIYFDPEELKVLPVDRLIEINLLLNISDLLASYGWSIEFVNSSTIYSILAGGNGVLIIPNIPLPVTFDFNQLRDFVDNGGHLIIVGVLPLIYKFNLTGYSLERINVYDTLTRITGYSSSTYVRNSTYITSLAQLGLVNMNYTSMLQFDLSRLRSLSLDIVSYISFNIGSTEYSDSLSMRKDSGYVSFMAMTLINDPLLINVVNVLLKKHVKATKLINTKNIIYRKYVFNLTKINTLASQINTISKLLYIYNLTEDFTNMFNKLSHLEEIEKEIEFQKRVMLDKIIDLNIYTEKGVILIEKTLSMNVSSLSKLEKLRQSMLDIMNNETMTYNLTELIDNFARTVDEIINELELNIQDKIANKIESFVSNCLSLISDFEWIKPSNLNVENELLKVNSSLGSINILLENLEFNSVLNVISNVNYSVEYVKVYIIINIKNKISNSTRILGQIITNNFQYFNGTAYQDILNNIYEKLALALNASIDGSLNHIREAILTVTNSILMDLESLKSDLESLKNSIQSISVATRFNLKNISVIDDVISNLRDAENIINESIIDSLNYTLTASLKLYNVIIESGLAITKAIDETKETAFSKLRNNEELLNNITSTLFRYSLLVKNATSLAKYKMYKDSINQLKTASDGVNSVQIQLDNYTNSENNSGQSSTSGSPFLSPNLALLLGGLLFLFVLIRKLSYKPKEEEKLVVENLQPMMRGKKLLPHAKYIRRTCKALFNIDEFNICTAVYPNVILTEDRVKNICTNPAAWGNCYFSLKNLRAPNLQQEACPYLKVEKIGVKTVYYCTVRNKELSQKLVETICDTYKTTWSTCPYYLKRMKRSERANPKDDDNNGNNEELINNIEEE